MKSGSSTLSAYASEVESLGFFRIFATPPTGDTVEITLFRGAPVTIGTVTFADPFTDATAQLSLPQVTAFDSPGDGDLTWLVPNTDIDIIFENTGAYDFSWRWEGFIVSYAMSLSGTSSGFSVDLKGALYALDDYLASPRFPNRPIPYEILMAMDFDQNEHPCRLGRFQILWPEDWGNLVPAFKGPNYLSALKPWGVATGKPWTGFTSRSTGSWNPLLSGHIHDLLGDMFASGGRQWSIRNLGHRRPQLFLRKPPGSHYSRIIEIQLGAPGVGFEGTRDYSQRADIIYGSGVDESGISFSGMQVTPDGKHTYYQPFAYSPSVYPRKQNPMLRRSITPKEVMVPFQSGVDEISAVKVAQAQYERFAEPGITGSITLNTDVRYADGSLCPRLLIKAGSTIRINGLLGINEGVLAHITQVSCDFKAMTTTLTYDTKYRDALTVDEVRARNRDAMNPTRWLQVGKYSATIQDLILPWSYKAGSGVIPLDAKQFFSEVLQPGDTWPYENRTIHHPPSNPAFRPWYIKLDPMAKHDSSKNWTQVAIPIRMGQTGSIRLTQIAAYDKDGHVLPVKFHASFYGGRTVTPDSMPEFPHDPRGMKLPNGDPDPKRPPLPYLKARQPGIPGTPDKNRPVIDTTYGEITDADPVPGFMPHPFFMQAWQLVDNNGFQWPWGSNQHMPNDGTEFVVGWGNYYEPAGYSPGKFSSGNNRTGLLEDTTQWTWNLTEHLKTVANLDNAQDPFAGMLHLMIYCDDNLDQPVYFMGRVVRAEPGAS